jgi:hypothetical protein
LEVGLQLKCERAVVQHGVQLLTVEALAEHVQDAMHRLLGVKIRRDAKFVEEPVQMGKGEAAQREAQR